MNQPKILIVDDDAKNIRLLNAMLMSENYQTFDCTSGELALKTVPEVNPDLILLDVMMPGIDGFEVCRSLKQQEETKIIPVVMVTALNETEHRLKALEAGADDFLTKPVGRTELKIRVKSLLRIKAYHDELLAGNREIARKNKKLLELEKIKEGLTHMIIHDLNNPLSVIMGNIELFLREKPALTPGQLERMTRCLVYCQDLMDMIQSMLDIQKMEQSKLVPDRRQTDISALSEEVLKQSDFKAAENKILLCGNGSDAPYMAAVDRNLVKRVLTNLVNNAIRHTPAGGRVDVKTDAVQGQDLIRLRVIDTGNGLAPEYHLKVFDKFEQVHLKKDGVKVGSSGLGLTFCKMAVEAHGGNIWVDSAGEGQGSTFQFTLPVEAPVRD